MITNDEIEEKASEFDIHAAHVERDYVFGWILAGGLVPNQIQAPIETCRFVAGN